MPWLAGGRCYLSYVPTTRFTRHAGWSPRAWEGVELCGYPPVSKVRQGTPGAQQLLALGAGQFPGWAFLRCDGSDQVPVAGCESASAQGDGQLVECDAGDHDLLEIKGVRGLVEVGHRNHTGGAVLELPVESPTSSREESIAQMGRPFADSCLGKNDVGEDDVVLDGRFPAEFRVALQDDLGQARQQRSEGHDGGMLIARLDLADERAEALVVALMDSLNDVDDPGVPSCASVEFVEQLVGHRRGDVWAGVGDMVFRHGLHGPRLTTPITTPFTTPFAV